MTATVTALIELAVDHGMGVAFLVVGAQVLLDRLNPVGYFVSQVFGAKKFAQGAGAHRRERETRPPRPSGFSPNHRNEPLGCMK